MAKWDKIITKYAYTKEIITLQTETATSNANTKEIPILHITQLVEHLTSDRRVGSSNLLAVQVPEIQNRSISGSKIGCVLVPE